VKVFTSRFSNPLLATWDGKAIGITRFPPRWKLGYPCSRLTLLAPTGALFNVHDREAFAIGFRQRLDSIGIAAIMTAIEQAADGHDQAAVLCFEDIRAEGVWCHREVLGQWLRENGVEVSELDDPSEPKAPAAKAKKPATAKVESVSQQSTFSWEV
jgi:hypothetical protein